MAMAIIITFIVITEEAVIITITIITQRHM